MTSAKKRRVGVRVSKALRLALEAARMYATHGETAYKVVEGEPLTAGERATFRQWQARLRRKGLL